MSHLGYSWIVLTKMNKQIVYKVLEFLTLVKLWFMSTGPITHDS